MQKFSCLFLLILFSSISYAQQIGKWETYTSMKDVSISVMDNNSNIWCATSGGIFMFNKEDSSYAKYTKADGLHSNLITSIAIDRDSKIWAGNTDGVINVITPSTGDVRSIFDIQKTNFNLKRINDLSVSGDSVFAATDFGITVFNSSTLSVIEDYSKFGNFLSAIKVFYSVKLDLIYACTESGLAIQKENAINLSAPESWDVFPTPNVIPADRILKVVKYNNGLAASTDGNGILVYENDTWSRKYFLGNIVKDIIVNGDSIIAVFADKIYSIKNDIPTLLFQTQGITLNSIILLNNNKLIVSSTNGIIEIANGSIEYNFPNGPTANSFPSIDVDAKGNLWSASGTDVTGKGVYFLSDGSWTNYNTQNGLEEAGRAMHKVYVSPTTDVYLSNWGNGFTKFDGENFETFNTSNTSLVGIATNPDFLVVQNMAADKNNNIWLVNSETVSLNALSVITTDSIYHFKPPLLSSPSIAEHLIIDRRGTKWFSISGEGLFYFNENGTLGDKSDDIWGRFTEADGLNDNAITALAIDNRDDIWIGTPIGVNYIFNPNNGDSNIQGLFSTIRQQSVNCIAVDAVNGKWFGTNQGVFHMSSDGITLFDNYTESNSPIPSNEITSLAADGTTGKIYVGTSAGLTSLVTTSLKPLAEFDEIFIYPNPFVLTADENRLVIKGLVRNSQIKILTISGKLVNELETPGGGITQWNGLDLEGKLVSSGIYLIVAYDEEANNVSTAKVAIIKE
jgi:ligand-binding sensor domain-containing protein